MLVSEVLRAKGSEVATLPSTATVAELVTLLAQRRIGAVVVCDEGDRVDGIASERDVVRAIAERGAGVLAAPVADIATHEVVTAAPSDRIADLRAIMTQGRFRHVPVVDDGRLCGIVSIGDVVKSSIDELASEAEALRHYIAAG